YSNYFYRKAITQQSSINLRGGSGNIAYLLFAGYDKVISNLNAKEEKINFRIENSYKPLKNLLINFSLLYTNRNSSNENRPSYNSINLNNRRVPYLGFADQNETSLPVSINYRNSFIDTAGGGKLLDWRYYPLEDYKNTLQSDKLQDLFANVGINYKIKQDIELDIKYLYEKQSSEG
ncbi:hypothetical protein, partial [Riemerella anatipestifer]|uniref:hypothetical protein n=1 Tax=Riemerella anatipestifer TaxID=34085 RepID=UPI0013A644AE